MKRFFQNPSRRRSRRGFTLVEAVLSVGIMSFGFLALAPVMALGLNSARVARENRVTSQLAATLIEEARQGVLPASPLYFDATGGPVPATQAVYTVQETITGFSPGSATDGPLSRLVLRVSPAGPVSSARIYADVFSTPPNP